MQAEKMIPLRNRVLRVFLFSARLKGNFFSLHRVFSPFWEVIKSRAYAAMANFWIGVNPPNAMFGRS
jgi:hypothetical protein